MSSLRKALQNRWLSDGFSGNEFKENQRNSKTKRKIIVNQHQDKIKTSNLARNTSVTKSLRDAVGTFRQKLRKSTIKRKRLQNEGTSGVSSGCKKTMTRMTTSPRKGYREFGKHSLCGFDSPSLNDRCSLRTRPKWHDVETPTRLRKEVEDLTSNMQALVALTPNTLQTRASSRRPLQISTPLTNGSLRKPGSGRKSSTVRKSMHTIV